MGNPQKLFLDTVKPPVTIYDTAADLNEVSGFSQYERGSESYNLPNWVSCGVEISPRCGCYPEYYQSSIDCCTKDSNILPNWGEGLPAEQPIDGLPVDRQPKVASADVCQRHVFKPLTVYVSLDGDAMCNTVGGLAEESKKYLDAYSHRSAASLLVNSVNGNPGLAAHATSVTPEGKVVDCVGLQFLHQNHPGQGALVVPWMLLGQLAASGLIVRTETGWVDAWGTPVVTDPGISGMVGPPATPWDGVTQLDPSTDFQTADPGCVWVYMTSGVWVGRSDPITPALNSRLSDNNVSGNVIDVVSEMQVLSVFNPCHVTAALVNVNKEVKC